MQYKYMHITCSLFLYIFFNKNGLIFLDPFNILPSQKKKPCNLLTCNQYFFGTYANKITTDCCTFIELQAIIKKFYCAKSKKVAVNFFTFLSIKVCNKIQTYYTNCTSSHLACQKIYMKSTQKLCVVARRL